MINENHYLESIRSDVITRRIFSDLAERKGSAVNFLQVGGNDGVLADPIYPFVTQGNWAGTIIEPVPSYFRLLEKAYANFPKVTALRLAIGRTAGKQKIFFVKDEIIQARRAADPDDMMQGVASFIRAHVSNPGFSDEEIDEVLVPVQPLSSVADRSRLIDVLLVDVEGSEIEVLSSMDWTIPVDVVVFESDHLSPAQRAAAEALFGGNGFEVFWRWPDSFAVSPRAKQTLAILEENEAGLWLLRMRNLERAGGLEEIFFRRDAPGSLLLQRGWSACEDGFTWSAGPAASILLPTSLGEKTVVAYELNYVAYAGADAQRVGFSINGRPIADVASRPSEGNLSAPQTVRVFLPECEAQYAELHLKFSNPVRPHALGLGNDRRELGIALSSVRLITE